MSKASGIVARIGEREGKYGPMYSIVLEGDETWYGTKSTRPACKVGDAVDFNFSVNPRGYSDADAGSVTVLEVAPEVAAPVEVALSTPTAGRVAHDRKQSVIVYQSSRKDALTLLQLAETLDIIDLPKKGTVADKFNAVRIFVDEATADYYTAAMDVYETGGLPDDDS